MPPNMPAAGRARIRLSRLERSLSPADIQRRGRLNQSLSGGQADGLRLPPGASRYTICGHPDCRRGSPALLTGLRREAERLHLALEVDGTLTICDGACRSGPFVGMPELGLFYAGLEAGQAREVLLETSLEGRMLHPWLWLNPTRVMDSRLVWLKHERVLVAVEAAYCLVGLTAYLLEFNARESCGKCFPCRLGVPRVDHLLRRLMAGQAREQDLEELGQTSAAMADGGYCQFAGRISAPLRLALAARPEEFRRHLGSGCQTGEMFL